MDPLEPCLFKESLAATTLEDFVNHRFITDVD